MNDDQILINQGVHTVLIDTWWNVNVNGKGCTREFEIVLIDTWWNVNDGGSKAGVWLGSF